MDRAEIERRVRAVYEAVAAKQPENAASGFAEDIVWHVPGDNPVSGRYEGRDYFTTMPERMGPLDRWDISLEAVMTNERENAALVAFHVVGDRRGAHIDMGGHHLVKLNDEGRIAEGWGFAEDQDALDEFFSA
jgi:ketosteroid isomerase-like protein